LINPISNTATTTTTTNAAINPILKDKRQG
jgi:hypothetical protein